MLGQGGGDDPVDGDGDGDARVLRQLVQDGQDALPLRRRRQGQAAQGGPAAEAVAHQQHGAQATAQSRAVSRAAATSARGRSMTVMPCSAMKRSSLRVSSAAGSTAKWGPAERFITWRA